MPSFMPIGTKLWALEGYIQTHTDRQSFFYHIDQSCEKLRASSGLSCGATQSFRSLGLRAVHSHSRSLRYFRLWASHCKIFLPLQPDTGFTHSYLLRSLGLCASHLHSLSLRSLELCASHSHLDRFTRTHKNFRKKRCIDLKCSETHRNAKKKKTTSFYYIDQPCESLHASSGQTCGATQSLCSFGLQALHQHSRQLPSLRLWPSHSHSQLLCSLELCGSCSHTRSLCSHELCACTRFALTKIFQKKMK